MIHGRWTVLVKAGFRSSEGVFCPQTSDGTVVDSANIQPAFLLIAPVFYVVLNESSSDECSSCTLGSNYCCLHNIRAGYIKHTNTGCVYDMSAKGTVIRRESPMVKKLSVALADPPTHD